MYSPSYFHFLKYATVFIVPLSRLIKEVIDIYPTVADPTIFKKNTRNMVSVTVECDLVSQVYPLMDARELMIEKNRVIAVLTSTAVSLLYKPVLILLQV